MLHFFDDAPHQQTKILEESSLFTGKNQIFYSFQTDMFDLYGKSVLDISGGVSNWSFFFAKQGCFLTFVHPSFSLLKQSRDNFLQLQLASSCHWIQAYFQKHLLSSLFDILHFREGTFEVLAEKHARELLSALYQSLQVGGFFVFEFINRDYFLEELPKKTYSEVAGRAVLEQMDFLYDTSCLQIRQQTFAPGGKEENEQILQIRLYSAHEIIGLLTEAGFSHQVLFDGSNSGAAFQGRVSPQLLILGRKNKES